MKEVLVEQLDDLIASGVRAEELAVKVGVSISTINNWIKGRNVMSQLAKSRVETVLREYQTIGDV